MKFFTTPAQRRILRRFWADNTPFSLDDLLNENVLHFRRYGKMLLLFMKWLGQILPCGTADGQTQYIGTTDSKEEWDGIWLTKNDSPFAIYEDFGTRGLNRYERQKAWAGKKEALRIIDKMIEETQASVNEE